MQTIAHRIAIVLEALHLIVAYRADVAKALPNVVVERLRAHGSRFFHRILERMSYAAGIRNRALNLGPVAVLQRSLHATA